MRFVIGDEEAGERVDVVIARHSAATRALAQRGLRSGSLRVDGEVVRPSHRVSPGEVVEGALPADGLPEPVGEDIPIEIRYEDERVYVVSKPPGLVTHPARGHEGGTLVNALLGRGGSLSGRGSTRPGIVHRLDKDTSGLLLVAKDDAAAASLVDALRARRVTRRYLALVRGIPATTTGTIDAPIARHPWRRRLMAVVPGGRGAVTHYRTLQTADRLALLEVTLETGRTHQIRVHLAHLGHPIIGDRSYGGGGDSAVALGLTRPFLHAVFLAFPHPDDDRVVEVSDPLSPDLASALAVAGIADPTA
ncbi:MAG TPA: RluA family pseudouridine synthase [Actinomycetota bacterium]|nr:RluA family pseudouridine synthase [Actinomycetota bacterium]